MQVSGTKSIQLSPLQTYQLLTSPDVIVRAMPGLKSLEKKSETFYEADIEVGVAGIKGRYDGSIEMTDSVPSEKYTLIVKGEGPMGFIEATANIVLSETEQGTTLVSYQGEAKVGGTVAGVGQRVLAGVSKLLINQFFNGIEKEAKALV
ncbi:MAG: carbon monoxide dehydrogenase [Alicyclobacillus sp. RIFOXYA1_FULL_53_8]|nr:MAG: carbon monoxide dehydrogenase [Alicyclobacillus sp. RIFOXYA1_FULL_53_8]